MARPLTLDEKNGTVIRNKQSGNLYTIQGMAPKAQMGYHGPGYNVIDKTGIARGLPFKNLELWDVPTEEERMASLHKAHEEANREIETRYKKLGGE